MCTDDFLIEVKEPNPRCAARNDRQAKIINRPKTARLMLDSTKWHLSDDAFRATTAQLTLSCMRVVDGAQDFAAYVVLWHNLTFFNDLN